MDITIKEGSNPAKACIIWMHGLGADSSDMAGLANEYPLAQLPLRHVFMNAPHRPVTINSGMMMRAWYDIVGITLTDREDEAGIKASRQEIDAVVDAQLADGFRADQIILAGFSQGGAMALYTALHSSRPLAGVISLSGYLPLAARTQFFLAKETPIFIGFGRHDPMVLPEWTQFTAHYITSQGYHNLSVHDYPMEHSICMAEVNDLCQWLKTLIGRREV